MAINYVGRPEGAISTKEAIEHGIEICMKKVAEAGGRPILVAADVSDEHAVDEMFDQVLTEYGRLDILVNDAGIQIAENSEDLSAADFDKVLAVNLRGAFLCARRAVRTLLASGQPRVIINVSSVHQVIPKPRFLGYSVSKGGMQNLARSLALEYAARGIRVNAIGPGATVTPINRSWIDDPVKRRMVESHIPMRRAGGSEEMAAAVAFLCSGRRIARGVAAAAGLHRRGDGCRGRLRAAPRIRADPSDPGGHPRRGGRPRRRRPAAAVRTGHVRHGDPR